MGPHLSLVYIPSDTPLDKIISLSFASWSQLKIACCLGMETELHLSLLVLWLSSLNLCKICACSCLPPPSLWAQMRVNPVMSRRHSFPGVIPPLWLLKSSSIRLRGPLGEGLNEKIPFSKYYKLSHYLHIVYCGSWFLFPSTPRGSLLYDA